MDHKTPPHHLEAEHSILGGLMLDNEAIYSVTEILRPEDFYKDIHQTIFKAMLSLAERNEPVDIITLSDTLKSIGMLDHVGGAHYISFLSDQVSTAANIAHYATIVREKSILRSVIQAATGVITTGYQFNGDIEGFLAESEKVFFDISQKQFKQALAPISDIIKTAYKNIEILYERGEHVIGVTTGYNDLDEITSGFQPADLLIIAGRPSMGKTAFALNVAVNAATKKKAPVAVFSLEMSKEQLVTRMLCSEARVDASRLRTGFLNEEDWPALAKAAGKLNDAPIYIDDTGAVSVNEIRSKLRRLMREVPIQMVVVDYLQLVTIRERIDSREQEISKISRTLKALAKELKIPIVVLSQLNRAVETRADKRPQMSDLRESGAIEQDADVIMFIYRDEVYNKESEHKGTAEIIISKQRNGPTGDVRLTFQGEYTRFENYESSSH